MRSHLVLANGSSLHGARYNEGLHLVLDDLGWDSE